MLAELVQTVQANGNEVLVLCLKPLGGVAASLQQAGITVKSLYKKHALPGQTVSKIRSYILSFRPDIIHAMLFRAMTYTRMACAGLSVKLITTPHFDLSKKSVFHRVADLLLKEKDTLTVAESYSTARYLIEHQRYRKDKVFLLPNSVSKSHFYKDDEIRKKMRETHSFHVKTIVFISVSRLVQSKNVILLLQAFRNLLRSCPEAKLVYIGEGPERIKLEKFINDSHMQSSVLLAGNQADVNAWLNMADVFVLPSKEECLPLSLLEALCVGLPCIVSNVGDMPLWVEHGKNGYVCAADDITLLSCLMKEAASSPQRRAEMGETSLQKSLCMADVPKEYCQLYQQIISNSFHVKTI